MNKYFFYGIFLDENTRERYGISRQAEYATVEGWATVGGYIVMAVPCEGATLTGLVAEVPDSSVNRLDSLERGYSKITVTTTDGEDVKMYVR